MSTLADQAARSALSQRIARLDPNSKPRWGRMNAPQMVAHLIDAFRMVMGEKYASPASNVFSRTVIKWVALHTPFPWPHGFPTRPEMEQGKGGTPPAEWSADCEELRRRIESFANCAKFEAHPMFGPLSRDEWMIWAYRHTDHHLRQFGA